MSRRKIVLDAWALLAFLQMEEPAATQVKALFQESQEDDDLQLLISVINLGEVYYRVGREEGVDVAVETIEALRRLGLTTLSATDERVFRAANFKLQHRMSYADAFAVASASEVSGVLLTGDPKLIQLDGVIEVKALTRHHR